MVFSSTERDEFICGNSCNAMATAFITKVSIVNLIPDSFSASVSFPESHSGKIHQDSIPNFNPIFPIVSDLSDVCSYFCPLYFSDVFWDKLSVRTWAQNHSSRPDCLGANAGTLHKKLLQH